MHRRNDDRGAALITVVLLAFISLVLIGTGLTAATSGLRQSVTSQRSTSALDAAFAGVQDYIARADADDTYVKYGNPSSKFTIASGSAATVGAPPTANPAFGITASGSGSTWAVVPGSDGFGKFRYEVDNSKYKTTGIVRLQVTGASGDRTRTLLVPLRVRGFVDYTYFTDYEIQDPQISGAPTSCVKHTWEGRGVDCGSTSTPPQYPDLRFGASDAVSGDVHSNDRMVICGTTFTGKLTTAQTGSGTALYSTRNCPSGTAKAISNISHADALAMPATNSSMKQDAGCLYTGPTQITYNDDGTMTVVSPWTQYTAVKDGVGSNPARCGALSALGSTSGARVPQLDGDLLYVQNVQTTAGTPNAWSTSDKPSGLTCIGADGQTTTATDGIGWSLSQGGGAAIRYPLTREAPATTRFAVIDSQWSTTTPAYGCRNGDLYVKGTVTTQTTAASENFVYVTGDVRYADNAADVLGLVGQNAVLVWNPMSKGDDQPLLSDTGREIDAAVVSVAHTFQVQNYDRGTAMRGTLKVFGSIAQKFRGPVAAVSPDTGYTKSYAYDALLKTVSPPKFLAAAAKSFTVTLYAAVPAAFTAAGAPTS